MSSLYIILFPCFNLNCVVDCFNVVQFQKVHSKCFVTCLVRNKLLFVCLCHRLFPRFERNCIDLSYIWPSRQDNMLGRNHINLDNNLYKCMPLQFFITINQ